MTIRIGKYTFEEPFTSASSLQERAGVYVIICNNSNTNKVVDVGESANVKSRVESHDRRDCWKRNCSGTLLVAVLYTPNQQQVARMAIEKGMRDQYNAPCGSR